VSTRPRTVVSALGLAAVTMLAGCARADGAASSTPAPLAVSVPGAAAAGGAEPALGLSRGGTGSWAGPGSYVLRGSLPTSPTRAPVVSLGTRGPADEATVRQLAAALGLATATRAGDDWVASSGGSRLRVYAYPGHPWVYARADAVACPPLSLDGFDPPGSAVACGYAVPAGPSGKPLVPSDAAVRTASSRVLAAAGLDPATAAVAYGAATVDPTAVGLPTEGVTTRVEVDASGVRTATGWLPDPRAGTTYPLLTAADVFRELQHEPRPMPACPMKLNGSGSGCRFADVVVTGARLGLALGWTAKGPVLVPAWAFTTRGGAVFRVAIRTRPVALPAPGQPVPAPAPGQPLPTAVPGSTGSPGSAGGGSAGSSGQAAVATTSS
jgi:hypothetical protein